VTFIFSEAPVAFTLADISAVGGTLSNLQQVNASTYTATFTGTTNSDTTNASVSVTAGSLAGRNWQCWSGWQHRCLYRRHGDADDPAHFNWADISLSS
jgi:hypothetical protein